MNDSAQSPINLQDVPALLSKYRGLVLKGILLSTIVFTVSSFLLPKKYKSHVVFTMNARYFHSPLIGDFVPGLSDSSDIMSQREALIRESMAPEFLDALGSRYGIYPFSTVPDSRRAKFMADLNKVFIRWGIVHPVSDESQIAAERQELRKRIEVNSINSNTFDIGFTYSDPRITYQATQDISGQVMKGLLEIRTQSLTDIRNAIERRVDSISEERAHQKPSAQEPSQAPSSKSPLQAPVEEELKTVRNQIGALLNTSSEDDPQVRQLRDRERTLVRWLGTDASNDTNPPPNETAAPAPPADNSKQAINDIYNDLSKKLNYLNIAMDTNQRGGNGYFAVLEEPIYPTAPIWPKKGLFAVWGVVFGFICSLFAAALMEYFERSTPHASSLAQQLNVPLLGELPAAPQKTSHPIHASEMPSHKSPSSS